MKMPRLNEHHYATTILTTLMHNYFFSVDRLEIVSSLAKWIQNSFLTLPKHLSSLSQRQLSSLNNILFGVVPSLCLFLLPCLKTCRGTLIEFKENIPTLVCSSMMNEFCSRASWFSHNLSRWKSWKFWEKYQYYLYSTHWFSSRQINLAIFVRMGKLLSCTLILIPYLILIPSCLFRDLLYSTPSSVTWNKATHPSSVPAYKWCNHRIIGTRHYLVFVFSMHFKPDAFGKASCKVMTLFPRILIHTQCDYSLNKGSVDMIVKLYFTRNFAEQVWGKDDVFTW